jgi:predicted acetyltransferase
VDLTYRAITSVEVPAFARASSIGFAESPTWFDAHPHWASLEHDRALVAVDGDDVVGTSRNYSLELTVPGGATLPAAGVSAVSVRPTHRRRGLLRTMMSRLLDDAVAHGEPVAMLTASEGSIYERFGFGISTRSMSIELDRRVVEFARPRPAGRLRLLDVDDAGKLEPDVFARTRRVYPGAVSRPDAWWSDEQWEPRLGVRFDVAYESPAGTVDGYVCYGIHGHYEPGVGAQNRLTVRDLVAVTAEARHALWRYLCEVDLVRTVVDPGAPIDLPLPYLLTSNRAMRVRGVNDAVWTRLLDVPASLEARTYPVSGRITLAVRDELRPGGTAEGTFGLEAGPDGATVTTGGDPDLVCDVSAASAAWLGGVRWSTLADAGVVEERVSGALTLADAMFASAPLPYPYTWF